MHPRPFRPRFRWNAVETLRKVNKKQTGFSILIFVRKSRCAVKNYNQCGFYRNSLRKGSANPLDERYLSKKWAKSEMVDWAPFCWLGRGLHAMAHTYIHIYTSSFSLSSSSFSLILFITTRLIKNSFPSFFIFLYVLASLDLSRGDITCCQETIPPFEKYPLHKQRKIRRTSS